MRGEALARTVDRVAASGCRDGDGRSRWSVGPRREETLEEWVERVKEREARWWREMEGERR